MPTGASKRQRNAVKLKKLCMAALFCALAFASTFFVHFKVAFLTLDIKDAIVTVAGLLFGPLYALAISAAVSLLEFFSQGETGVWGFLMDILSTATFSTTCALIYQYKKNFKGAIVGLCASALAMTSAMLLFNLFVTPIYMGVSRAEVVTMIPTLLLPFNLIKAVLNAATVMILYKPISRAMKAAGVLPSVATLEDMREADGKQRWRFSLVMTAVALVIIVLCVTALLVFMNGRVELGS